MKTRFWIYSEYFFQTNLIFAQNSDVHSSYLLETLRNTCPLSFFWLIRRSDQDSKSFIRFMSYIHHLWIRLTLFTSLFLCLLLLLDTMTRCHFNYQVLLLTFSCTTVHTVVKTFIMCMCAPYFSPSQLPYFIDQQHNSQVPQAPQAIVQCVPVPTHLAYETLGEQTNLFLVRKASLTIFSSFQCAKHFWWIKVQSCLPIVRKCLQSERQWTLLLIFLRNNDYGWIPRLLNIFLQCMIP